MEFFGFEKSMKFLLSEGIPVERFITDRHATVAKCMREKYQHIKHMFDLWHIQKNNNICEIINLY